MTTNLKGFCFAFFGLIALCCLPGLVFGQTSSSYNTYQQQQPVEYGVVTAVREVKVQDNNSTARTVGTVVGAGLGGLAGAKITNGNARWIVGGALGTLGGVAGAEAGSRFASEKAQEIIVKTDSGREFATTQSAKDGVHLSIGQRVRLIGSYPTRLVPM